MVGCGRGVFWKRVDFGWFEQTNYLSDYDRYALTALKEQALDYQYGGKKVSYEEFMEISEKSELRMEFIDMADDLLEAQD